MIDRPQKTMPVAVWVERFESAQQAISYDGYICDKSARIRATSPDRTLALNFLSNPLTRELFEKLERLDRHGFTVIDVPETWSNEHNRPQRWVEALVNQALDRVMKMQDEFGREEKPVMYDEALANAVLTALAPKYPHQMNMTEIKSYLKNNEPSDDELLTVLQALLLEGLISGDAIPDRTSGKRRLLTMMKIRITKEGRQHLSGVSPVIPSQAVVHQYNNFGQSGAMGPNSVGTINYQQQWAASAGQFDLSQVAAELQTLKAELLKTAKTADDFNRVSVVAQAEEYAEKQDGSKVLEVLAKSGGWLFDFATKVGTDITAKLLAKSMGLEP